MKTVVSVGWCAMVALLFSCFSAIGRAEESQSVTSVAKPSAATCQCAGGATPADLKIVRTLAEPLKSTGLDFTEEPLENVVNFLQQEYDVPIQIDEGALEDAGLTRDEHVTISVRNISLRSALRLLLVTKQLTYVIRNEVLIITTPEVAETNLVTCVYDVRDVVSAFPRSSKTKGGKSATANFHPLIDAIVSCVHCETWSENGGGEAEIRPLPPGLLVISQTQAVHEQVAELLNAIRETLHQPEVQSAGEAMGMMGGSGGYGMAREGMEGGGRGYGEESYGEGGYGVGGYGDRGEMERPSGKTQPEPTPAETTPSD